jgi:hypothetical protein
MSAVDRVVSDGLIAPGVGGGPGAQGLKHHRHDIGPGRLLTQSDAIACKAVRLPR